MVVTDKATQENVMEMYTDDIMNNSVLKKEVKPEYIYQLLNKGYSPVFKCPDKVADELSENTPEVLWIAVKEGYWYLRMKEYKMTSEEIKALEYPHYEEFRGKVKDLENEKRLDNPDVQEEFVTDYKGKVEVVSEKLVTIEVLDVKDFDKAKANMEAIVKGLRYGEVWKKELLKTLENITTKEDLNKYAEYFYAENKRASERRRQYRDNVDDGGYAEDQYAFYGDGGLKGW